MNIDLLCASNGKALSKAYRRGEYGEIIKDSYPSIREFSSLRETVNDIETLYAVLSACSENGGCLLKGQLDTPLYNESRADHTNSNDKTELLVLDNDYLHDISPDELLSLLGLEDTDYILQHSASAGIVPGHNGYHLFVLLNESYSPDKLKLILKKWNLTIPQISNEISLSASGVSLKWPLDISVCQNDKLIYIAPPICGEGIKDPFKDNRITLVKKAKRHAVLEHLS